MKVYNCDYDTNSYTVDFDKLNRALKRIYAQLDHLRKVTQKDISPPYFISESMIIEYDPIISKIQICSVRTSEDGTSRYTSVSGWKPISKCVVTKNRLFIKLGTITSIKKERDDK